ncbi:SOS response-associated peptidase [Halopenitus persicus]|uniref:SOS response-associated peptidase n=1 Tax=Halopenitus persicus TaxID=1048396 RepID=UPI000BBAF757|nr:SOS response-associated peptidase [Halopenitus persicus]
MCGRYSLSTPRDDLRTRFDAAFPDVPPRYNCAPGQRLPVITADAPAEARRLEWGLTPAWADDRLGLINARAETIREKPAFRSAFERRRCLVPADGFYEWVETGSGTRPYRVAFADDRPFAMAGIYERWEPPEPDGPTQTGLDRFAGGSRNVDGNEPDSAVTSSNPTADAGPEPVETFSIVTTEPNDLVADLHHRMAVILDPADEERYLHGDPETAASLLEPVAPDDLRAHPVSERVNDPSNDDPSLIEPV